MYELFDLDADPYELHNVYNATAAAQPALVRKLHQQAREWYECAGPACRRERRAD
eukprot:gene15526-13101_t